MAFAIDPPVEPMLAKLATEVPGGAGFLYEPKWDGFRAIVFRAAGEVYIQSRDLKPLDRYFPELSAALLAGLPDGCVLDGEIVIATPRGLDFDALQMRLHPAASRRARLEQMLAKSRPLIHLTPMTRDHARAVEWLSQFEGAGLDGVMAKPVAAAYLPGKRAMIKVKHERTADCVVAGFRWHKAGRGELVGSLLLGLYDDQQRLQHVGVTSSFTMARRRQLAEELAPLREGALAQHPWQKWSAGNEPTRKPGGHSRWSAGKDLSWEPLRIERVCEVKYDHMQGTRFRHAALDFAGQRQRRPAHLVEAPAPLDAHVDVHAARAGGLGPAGEADLGEHGAHDLRDRTHLRPPDARHRVEVDAQLVGMVEVIGAHRVRMQLQAREVGHPCQRGGIARHHLLGGASRRKLQRHYVDPRRPRCRRPLLVEELLADSVGVALEDVGPMARAAQRALGNSQVITGQVELGVPGLREQDLGRVGDRDLVIADPQQLSFRLRRHDPTITMPGAARRADAPGRRAAPGAPRPDPSSR